MAETKELAVATPPADHNCDLSCPICFKILVYPRQCRFGHVFCSVCVHHLRYGVDGQSINLSGGAKCPICTTLEKYWPACAIWWTFLQRTEASSVAGRLKELGCDIIPGLNKLELRQYVEKVSAYVDILFEGMGLAALQTVAYIVTNPEAEHDVIMRRTFASSYYRNRHKIPTLLVLTPNSANRFSWLKQIFNMQKMQGNICSSRFCAIQAGASIYVFLDQLRDVGPK
jgi:hypothetical protein